MKIRDAISIYNKTVATNLDIVNKCKAAFNHLNQDHCDYIQLDVNDATHVVECLTEFQNMLESMINQTKLNTDLTKYRMV